MMGDWQDSHYLPYPATSEAAWINARTDCLKEQQKKTGPRRGFFISLECCNYALRQSLLSDVYELLAENTNLPHQNWLKCQNGKLYDLQAEKEQLTATSHKSSTTSSSEEPQCSSPPPPFYDYMQSTFSPPLQSLPSTGSQVTFADSVIPITSSASMTTLTNTTSSPNKEPKMSTVQDKEVRKNQPEDTAEVLSMPIISNDEKETSPEQTPTFLSGRERRLQRKIEFLKRKKKERQERKNTNFAHTKWSTAAARASSPPTPPWPTSTGGATVTPTTSTATTQYDQDHSCEKTLEKEFSDIFTALPRSSEDININMMLDGIRLHQAAKKVEQALQDGLCILGENFAPVTQKNGLVGVGIPNPYLQHGIFEGLPQPDIVLVITRGCGLDLDCTVFDFNVSCYSQTSGQCLAMKRKQTTALASNDWIWETYRANTYGQLVYLIHIIIQQNMFKKKGNTCN